MMRTRVRYDQCINVSLKKTFFIKRVRPNQVMRSLLALAYFRKQNLQKENWIFASFHVVNWTKILQLLEVTEFFESIPTECSFLLLTLLVAGPWQSSSAASNDTDVRVYYSFNQTLSFRLSTFFISTKVFSTKCLASKEIYTTEHFVLMAVHVAIRRRNQTNNKLFVSRPCI